MMLCNQCGHTVEEGCAFCPVCGTALNGQTQTDQSVPVQAAPAVTSAPAPKTNAMAVAGFICSFFTWFLCGIPGIVGLILSIVGLAQIKNRNEGGKGFAIAGIIIAPALFIAFIVILVFFGALSWIF